MPPIVTSLPPMSTRAAASFGNGSVVMIARAACGPLIRAERGDRRRQPAPDLVDRQRDADDAGRRHQHLLGRAPDERGGFGRHLARDLACPSSPVQAFAQPLLTMIARAVPPDRARCSRETSDRRRLRVVGREDRGGGRRRVRDQQREVEAAVRP